MTKKPNDAAKIAGLASILQSSNKPKEPPPSPAPPKEAPIAETPPPAARPARAKVGKSSDPNFNLFGFYVRKTTHKQVKRRLEDLELGKDVSDLVQELFEQWLASNS